MKKEICMKWMMKAKGRKEEDKAVWVLIATERDNINENVNAK